MPPSFGRELLRWELALNDLEFSPLRVLHLLLLLQVIWLQMHMLIRLLPLILHLLLWMIRAFVVCWTLSWPFRRLMVNFWWMCSRSFRRCMQSWWVLDSHLDHLLLMMGLDCPLAICHKKGEYIWIEKGGEFFFFFLFFWVWELYIVSRCFTLYLFLAHDVFIFDVFIFMSCIW